MKKQRMVPALLLAIALGGCTDELLNVLPVDEISDEIAIIDATSAYAALAGAYGSVQTLYGTSWVMWTDILTDDVEHTGTFGSWADGDLHNFRPNMGTIDGLWTNSYAGIDRVNRILLEVPDLDMDPADYNDILGQAYGLRALHYFNLVRAWGDVPLVLVPPANLDEAGQVTRDPLSAVYAQIDSDLGQAASFLAGMGNDDHNLVTPDFITAMQAKVAIYQEDWGTAASKAQQLVNGGNYALPADPRSAFTADGDPSTEDIFRVAFTVVDWNNLGYYYLYEGRFEIGSTQEIYELFEAGDLRHDMNYPDPGDIRSDGIEVTKYPTPIGAEEPHVIRYGEVLLFLAEALAEQNQLPDAVGYMNQIRTRAGLAGYVMGTDLFNQQEVLDAIYLERRLELAFEGHRWFDLVRTGKAMEVLGPGGRFEAHEVLWPIPVGEMDTAPNLVQNPGY